MNTVRIISALTAALVASVAIAALALSYNALQAVAIDNGIDGWQSYVWPLLVDASLVVFSLAVVRNSLRQESTVWPWALVGLYTAATVGFNLVHSPQNITAWLVAIVAPVSLFLAFETLMGQLKSETKRLAAVVSLEQLTSQATQAAARRDRITGTIDTLTTKRDAIAGTIDNLKKEVAELRKAKKAELTNAPAQTTDETKSAAEAILAERSDISGAELGRMLGKSPSLGRRLKRELVSANGTNGTGVTQ